jgi:hypothetical protein
LAAPAAPVAKLHFLGMVKRWLPAAAPERDTLTVERRGAIDRRKSLPICSSLSYRECDERASYAASNSMAYCTKSFRGLGKRTKRLKERVADRPGPIEQLHQG